ncbi:MAG: L-type lectin-domain containing protein, partial [Eubacteriales bacterium]|nr:L-type lectin-domain containing protein [Eubacteriales bacterium]
MNKAKKLVCFTLALLTLLTGFPLHNYYESNAALVPTGGPVLSPDEQAVADDKAWLSANFTALNDYPFLNWLKTDLTFPATGPNGSSISWSSSDIALLDNTGKVHRPAYSGPNTFDLVLSATLTKGTASDTTTFNVSVVPLPGSLSIELGYDDIETVSNSVSINGSAQPGNIYISNANLFTVNNDSGTAGSVFSKNMIQLADDLSFSTYFVFDIASMYSGYDEGFTFTLQTDSATALGTGEFSSMGAPAISPSLSIEFDTKRDSATAAYEYQGADAEHHVAVYVNGDYQNPLAVAPAEISYPDTATRNFSANQKFNVWIQYDGTAKVLEVYQVMENLNEPTVPVISTGLDLASVFKTPDNEIIRDVYAGFTGHGADAFSTRAAIYKWSFKNDKYPIEYGLPEMT